MPRRAELAPKHLWQEVKDHARLRFPTGAAALNYNTLQKEKQQKRQKGLVKNDTVRIIRGMFAGKQGVVQEVDAKGGLRVLVGKVAVKLDAEDVQKR